MKKLTQFLIATIILYGCEKTKYLPELKTEQKLVRFIEADTMRPTFKEYLSIKNDNTANARRRPVPKPKPTPIPTPTIGVILYINMDGKWVNDPNWYTQESTGRPFYAPPATLTLTERQTVIMDAMAAYSKWEITVTTDSNLYKISTLNKIEIVVTPYAFVLGSGSGYAFVGSMFYGTPEMAFVFTGRLYNTAEFIGKIVTHETGHSIGLLHQSIYNLDCSLLYRYAPDAKMGSHWTTIGLWKYGTSYACNIFQDDEKYITSKIPLK